jgi:long-chain acyl-CoA synthetase
MSALAARLDAACAALPNEIAVVGQGVTLRYADLHRRANDIAKLLSEAECGANEPVLAMMSNHPHDFAVLLGAWRAGAVVVPVHRSSPPVVIEAIRTACSARIIIDQEPRTASSNTLPTRPLLDGAALVIFTSGSTGEPKGVVLSHRALARKLDVNGRLLGFKAGERTLLVLNITFSFGIWVSLLTLCTGGQLIAQPKFEPASFVAALAHEEIARVGVVPTMMRALFAAGVRPTASPAQILIGGEPLGAPLAADIRKAFPESRLIDIYGLTETSTSDVVLGAEEQERYAGCIGRAAPQVELRIANETGQAVAAGEIGELQIRTPFIMNGYLDRPDLSAVAFSGTWFRTGDMARVAAHDERGPVMQLVGRMKELIVRGGHKISPLEIEQAIATHPDVAAAMAAGLPDAILGERIHALVVPRIGAHLESAALRAFCADRLERYKLPDVFYVGEALPLGRTGKADRGGLRLLIERGELKPLAA